MDWDKEPKKHPAYGHAIFCRVTGRVKLFASPLLYHNEFISLTISTSELRHELSRDWRFSGKELIEVYFSAAQFAQLLTTMNVGEGAPCTINHIAGKGKIEPIPENEDTEQGRVKKGFAGELSVLIGKMTAHQKEVDAILEKRTIGKKDRDVIRTAWAQVRQQVECNWPFVVDQFERATIKLETAAKAEIESVVTALVAKLGIEKLHELHKALPFGDNKQLGDGEDDGQ